MNDQQRDDLDSPSIQPDKGSMPPGMNDPGNEDPGSLVEVNVDPDSERPGNEDPRPRNE